MKILLTGGCGYKGNVLTPKLLKAGHQVRVLDTMWFGNDLQNHPELEVTKQDVRLLNEDLFDSVDTIIHLASVANDPAGDLDPALTWEIGALATMQLADNAVRHGVKQFIYSSSGSVYGLKDEKDVVETLPLVPLSEYNKTKMVAERALLSYADEMSVQIVRPATVCGLSPRMRLDVAVNMLTIQALTKGEITVLGGNQTRPNIHIEDITDLYMFLLENPEITGVFNAGFENLTILEIAEMVCGFANASIKIQESNDPRSYRVNSDKLLKTGFRPKKTVELAIMEMCDAFKIGSLKDDERFHTVSWMKKTLIKS
jgi:nucleoside-diphosphate-sugar epimerase